MRYAKVCASAFTGHVQQTQLLRSGSALQYFSLLNVTIVNT